MKKVLQALQQEIAWAGRSAGAAVSMAACLVLPALYVLFVLSAAWNPFGGSSAAMVAIANEDTGCMEDGQEWNLGGELLEELEAGSTAGLVQLNKADAITGVNAGKYYAALVIPTDFSTLAIQSLSGGEKRPAIAYYINEKKDVLSPKGVDGLGLVQQRVEDVLSKALSNILHLPGAATVSSKADLLKALEEADAELASCEAAVQALLQVTGLPADDTAAAALPEGQETSAVGNVLAAAKESASEALRAAQEAQGGNDTAAMLEVARSSSETIANDYRELYRLLEEVDRQLPGKLDSIDGMLSLFEEGAKGQDRIVGQFAAALAGMEDGQLDADTARALVAATDEARGDANYIDRYYRENMEPQLGNLLIDTSGIADRYTGEGEGAPGRSGQASDDLSGLKTRLEEARKRVQTALAGLQSTGDSFGNLSGAVAVERQTLYPVENYGATAAPYYTAVALWLGCLLLVSRRRSDLRTAGGEIKPSHAYWGRFLAFLLAALVQATAVCLIELWALDVQCKSPLLFLLSGWISALSYGSIVFGLTEAFGSGGRAVGILLLAVQAACAGAAFPAETAPVYFGWVNALMPVTYGMGAMRETVAGFYRSGYLQNLLLLSAYAPVFLALGALLHRNSKSGSAAL